MQIHIYELNPYFIMQSSILSENLETGFAFLKWVWLKFCLVLLIATLFPMLIMTDALKKNPHQPKTTRKSYHFKAKCSKIFLEKELYLITVWDLTLLTVMNRFSSWATPCFLCFCEWGMMQYKRLNFYRTTLICFVEDQRRKGGTLFMLWSKAQYSRNFLWT